MKYQLAYGYDDLKLADHVEALAREGWKPQGGVAVCVAKDRDGFEAFHYYQAMVRDTPEEGPEAPPAP